MTTTVDPLCGPDASPAPPGWLRLPIEGGPFTADNLWFSTTAQVGDVTYVYGGEYYDFGSNPPQSPTTNFWAFDGSWSTREVITERDGRRVEAFVSKAGHCMVQDGDSFLAYGGTSGGVVDDVLMFMPQADGTISQVKLSRTPTDPWPAQRAFHTCVWDSDRRSMLVFGGTLTPLSAGALARFTPGQSDELWEYARDSGTWTDLTAGAKASSPSSPAARAFHTAVWESASGLMYVYGGLEYSPAETLRNGVWIYSRSDSTWSRLSDTSPPPARYAHVAIATGSSMFVYGGIIEGRTVGQYDCLWQFSFESQSWTNTQDCKDSLGRDVEASLYGSAVLDQCRKRILFFGFSVWPWHQYGLEA